MRSYEDVHPLHLCNSHYLSTNHTFALGYRLYDRKKNIIRWNLILYKFRYVYCAFMKLHEQLKPNKHTFPRVAKNLITRAWLTMFCKCFRRFLHIHISCSFIMSTQKARCKRCHKNSRKRWLVVFISPPYRDKACPIKSFFSETFT